ncbi:MAG: RHS repeat domain-containing protein [Steroidobacteraceae bacterium]
MNDSRANSLVTKAIYKQPFPYTGMPVDSYVYQHDGATVVTHSKYTNQDMVLHSNTNNDRHFPYVPSVTTDTYEVSGILNGSWITSTLTTTTLDSYGNATASSTTVTDKDSTSPNTGLQWSTTTATIFAIPDTGSNWCVNLPTSTTSTHAAPGVANVVRTKAFDSSPDYVHCRPNQVVTEPSSGTYAVTQALGYDAFGNVASVTTTGVGMGARLATGDWGTTGQFPVMLRDPVSNALGTSGYKTLKGYDYNLGVQTSEVIQSFDGSANNAPATAWQYDPFGRKQRETRPDGTYTVWSYNDCANWTGCPVASSHTLAVGYTVFNTDGTIQTAGSTWFDPLDRPTRSNRRELANGAYALSGVLYDNLGRVTAQFVPCTSSTIAPCPYGVTMAYDALGRMTQRQRPISATNPTLQTETFQYAGRTTVTTDPYGKNTTKVATVTGTVYQSKDHDNYYQTFLYDAVGSLLSVADSLSQTLFTANYDYGIGVFQRDATDMDLDLSTTSGQHRHFIYNALGELTSWSDAKGQSFSATYDALSRPLTRIEPDLTTTWTWGNSAIDHNVGQLSGVSANGYLETYTYDAWARPFNRSVTIPSDATYGYDLAYNSTTGLLDTLTYPTTTSSYRLKLAYAYQNGFLQRVSDANAGTVYWQANTQNALAEVTQETLGNAVITTRAFDDVTGWLGSITSGLSGTTALENNSYLYDQVGNVTQRQNNNVGLTENFYYDDVYRLDHSSLNGTVNLQMGYNAAGNITSRSDLAGGATWSYDATHRHAVVQAGSSANTFTYDANGNATSRNGLGISWTSYNHPLVINTSGIGESVQFAYNQNHQRWSAILSGSNGIETTYFVGDLLEKIVSAGSNDYRHYIYAAGTKVAVYSRTSGGVNTLHYLREDHQGGVDAILNSDGTGYAKESFTAFGARRSSCTWSGPPTSGALAKINAVTRHAYTWQTALGAMGLNDMNGRIQDAITGRFLSADPYVPQPDITQSFNRYSYVMNNPLTYSDPSGFEGQVTIPGKRPTDGYNPALPGKGAGGNGSDLNESGKGGRDSTKSQKPGHIPPPKCGAGGCIVYQQMCVLVDGAYSCTTVAVLYLSGGGFTLTGNHPSGGGTNANGSGGSGQANQSPQGNQAHHYGSANPTTCTPSDGFSALKAAGVSAPGAAAAQENTTSPIDLWYIFTPNQITQVVNTPNMTLVNIALPGHIFQGTVRTKVTPFGTGSLITTSGAGESWYWGVVNDIFGALWFGFRNAMISDGCDAMNGIPTNY